MLVLTLFMCGQTNETCPFLYTVLDDLLGRRCSRNKICHWCTGDMGVEKTKVQATDRGDTHAVRARSSEFERMSRGEGEARFLLEVTCRHD